MSLKLSVIPATAVAIAPSDLLYLAKDMGGGVFLEHKMPGSVLDAKYGQIVNPLSQFAATTSAQLAGIISDEVGTGALVFKTYVDTVFAAGVTSFNARTGAVTFLAADLTSVSGAFTTGTLAQFAATTSAQLAGVISDETGTGLLMFNINPTIAGATFSAVLNMGSNLINNVTNPVNPQDAATKAYVDSVASAPPFIDSTALIKGSADATKLLRFEVDGFTTVTTRVLTPPNANATIAGLEVAQTFTAVQTMGANLLFSPDNTFDIGAFMASRPRTIFVGTSLIAEIDALGATTVAALQLANLTAAAAGAQQYSPAIQFYGRGWKTTATAASQAVDWRIYNQPVQGTTAPTGLFVFEVSINGGAFTTPALLKSNGDFTVIGAITAGATQFFLWSGRSVMGSSANGIINLFDNTGTNFTRLTFGGTSSAFPAIGRNGTILEVLAADGASVASLAIYNTKTSTTNFERLDLRWTTNVAEIFTEKGSGGGTARDLVLGADATEVLRFTSAGATYATAKTVGFRQGTNTRAGNAVLVAGTVTVANTTVTANTLVMLTRKTSGGTLGFAITYTVTAATSFTITSDSALDTSTFSYVLIENPA